MPTIEEQLQKKKLFKKKSYRSYLSLDETLDDLPTSLNTQNESAQFDEALNSKSEDIPESEGKQLVSKKEAISNLIGNQLVSNKESEGNQLVSNEEATKEKENSNWEAIGKPIGKPIGKQLVSQLVSKNSFSEQKSFEDLMRVVGIESKVLSCILESCLARGQLTSAPLQLEFLAKATGTTKKTIKTTGQRLIKKGFLLRADGKRGKGGWTVFSVSETTRNAFLEMNRMVSIGKQLGSQLVSELVSNKEAKREATPSSSSSSSSLIDNKTTTTEEPQIDDKTKQDLPPEWETIDFNDLSEIHFGRPQLKQWCDRKYCSAEQAQESIYHFAFYLKHAKKGDIKTGPLNFFMGIMAKQHYFPRPDGYLSPEEAALKQRTEDLKKKNDSLTMIERDLYDYAFDIWFRSLTEDEIQTLVPTIFNYEPRKSALRGVFIDKYWLKFKSNPHLDPARLGKSEEQQVKEVSSKHEELSPEEVRRLANQQFGSIQVQEVSSS